MFDITSAAIEKVAEHLKDMEVKPIRIFLQSGCGGSAIALALDQEREGDHVFKAGDFAFVADKEFMAQAKPVRIDFTGNGFKIDSPMELGGGCGGCAPDGGCDTKGSCCS